MPKFNVPLLPPPRRAALLLDLDGTLLDIAASPESVEVAPGLPDTLRRLRVALGDALAIVTGRPVAQVDALLPDLPYAVAGEHGGALRPAPGAAIERAALPEPPAAWLAEAARLVEAHPGARLERKAHGFVLHYRAIPAAGEALRAPLAALIADEAAGRFTLLAAHMAWEIRPQGVDKGAAVRALMQRPPFVCRLPVFIGDDVTDEDGIAAAIALGGAGLRVAEAFGDPLGVRAWLGRWQ
jgi:trehalose 6-phosphate phosphatase